MPLTRYAKIKYMYIIMKVYYNSYHCTQLNNDFIDIVFKNTLMFSTHPLSYNTYFYVINGVFCFYSYRMLCNYIAHVYKMIFLTSKTED